MEISSKSYRAQAVTNRIIDSLWNSGQPNRAALSGLRTAKTISSHQAVSAWPALLGFISEEELSRTGKPTRGEIAIFTAVRAFALYQQGNNERLLNKDGGKTVMEALSLLRAGDPNQQAALDRRTENLLSTTQLSSLLHQLISIVSIVKSKGDGGPLDLGQLARDLYEFQTHVGAYNGAQKVILRWGQQYYAGHHSESNSEEK